MAKSARRLYRELKPHAYILWLEPDVTSMSFRGTVAVRLRKAGRPSERITFHQTGLKVTAAQVAQLKNKGRRELRIVRLNAHDRLNEIRIHTQDTVYAGAYEVSLKFHGKISENMTGLYPSYCQYEGSIDIVLATQFEPHYARNVFPCIDEPEAKATFELTLVTPSELTAIANMPPAGVKPVAGGRIEMVFQPTPAMSPYLLAFVIGMLHSTSSRTKRGTTVSVWATRSQPLKSLDFALDVAVRTLEFFEYYFGIDYPLPKLDHVALPDFGAGAMENWGLVTCRERLLLAYPGAASQSLLEHIAIVIAHETAHQWFGDMVTMRWWDDLWLNESFANLMEYQALDALFPEWQVWENFIAHEGIMALHRDASPFVPPVQTAVHSPYGLNSLFDPAIIYAKGGRLLYMLMAYIGSSAFRQGIRNYFTAHAYDSASSDDLWKAFTQSCHLDVKALMHPWLEQPGFPEVSVEQVGRNVAIHQQRFLENGEHVTAKSWVVPLFSDVTGMPATVSKTTSRITVAIDRPIILNRGAVGHYIVNYLRPEHRDHLRHQIEKGELGPPERLKFLADTVALSKAGRYPFTDVLRLLQVYKNEEHQAVWSAIAAAITETSFFAEIDGNVEISLKRFYRGLIQLAYHRFDWHGSADEPASIRKLRTAILAIGTYAEYPAIVDEARKRFSQSVRDSSFLAAETRAVTYGVAVKYNVPGAFDYLLTLYDATSNSDLKSDIMFGLSMTEQPRLINLLLDRLTNTALTKPQDVTHWFRQLLVNPHARPFAWEWLVNCWPWITEVFAEDFSYHYFPRYAANVGATDTWIKKYEAFFSPKQRQPELQRDIAIGLQTIKTHLQWANRDLTSTRDFFDSLRDE